VRHDETRGPVVGTATAGWYYPVDPRPEEIKTVDLGVQLSRICRFNGALDPSVSGIYSVAQHLVHCCDVAPFEFKLEALLHDAHEAYIHDIIKPVKDCLPDYRQLERLNEAVLRKKFGLPKKMSPEVKEIDGRMYATEERDLCHSDWAKFECAKGVEPYPFTITAWTPKTAREQWISRLQQLWSGT
jgi:hypothetical protein